MGDREVQPELKLGRGSQIVIGLFSLLFMGMFLLWASTAEGGFLLRYSPAVFCGVVAGACILPQPLKGYCGDLIAVVAILLAVWFLLTSLPNPEPGESPIKFALVFGGISLVYLVRRYKHVFSKAST